MITLLLLLLTLLATPTVHAAIYFTDKNSLGGACNSGNPGTITAPRCTINQGLSLLGSGDTLFIRAGTYTENIHSLFGNVPNGTNDNNRTTIAAYQQEVVTMTANSSAVIYLGDTGNVGWLLFDRIIIDGATMATASGSGIVTAGDSHDIKFQNFRIVNSPGHGISGGGTRHQYINGVIDNGREYGVYYAGSDTLFDHVDISNTAGYGMHLFNSRSISVSNNIIRNSRYYNNGFGVNPNVANAFQQGSVILSSGSNNQFYNNIVYNSNRYGIQIDYRCLGCKVYNNVIYGMPNTAIQMGNGGDFGPNGETTINTVIRNNIMFNNTGGDFSTIGVPDPSPIISNNVCPSCDYTGNPLFEDAANGDFRIKTGSPAINNGLTLTSYDGLTTDITGAVRNQGPWDIGAYEFNGGTIPTPTGNPIYVAATGGTPAASGDCIAAENQATPFRTIAFGLACMGVTPGKTMYIKAGLYAECIDTLIQPIKGGNGPSFANATVIASFGNDAVTIKPTSCTQGVVLFARNGVTDSFIVFRGSAANRLVIDGTNIGNNIALGAGANNIRFEFVDMKNSASFEAFYASQVTNVSIVDSLVHGAATHGIAFDGTNTNILIERTMVYSNGTLSTHHGINQKGGSIAGLTVKESTSKLNAGKGIAIATSTSASVFNSLIYNNGGVGIHVQTGAGSTKVYNSTISGNNGNGFQCDSGATTMEIKNSIVFGNIAGNLVNNCTATVATNLCSPISANCDIADDPLFVGPVIENYRLADGSPGIDCGTTILSLTVDYAGAARQQGQQDRGAYERTQAPGAGGPDVTVFRVAPKQAGMFFSLREDYCPYSVNGRPYWHSFCNILP